MGNRIIIEVCAADINSIIAAERGGAHRIELCDNLLVGGTTPSAGMIKLAIASSNLDICVLIRPRGGDFMYNDLEFEIMKQDILMAKELGADGIVTGVLDSDGLVDIQRMQVLAEIARPMEVVFHRAFDMTSDPNKCLDQLIELKIDRLLTSGLKNTAIEGAAMIRELMDQAKGRIDIMPGSGINTENFSEIKNITKASCFHLTGRKPVSSKMNFQSDDVVLNSFSHQIDFQWLETDSNIVTDIVSLSNS